MNFDTLIEKMTLEEKASLMSGGNFWNSEAIERLNIPSFMLTDGPHGLRKQGGKADHLGLNKSIPATCFPTAATLANSWDQELMYGVGAALGKEAAHEDVSVLLGPGMNIKRNPLCGRNFEYFSEDPYLTGKLASFMIQGIQSEGVAACAKHFAVNSQELHRMSVDEIVDQRALHEIYLEAFRISVEEGKVQAMMTAYNKVNGVYANEHDYLLEDVLKERWGFDGLIVTDWGGNNDRVAALKAGNQLEMPSTNGMTDQDIVSAVEAGTLSESILDLRVKELLQFIDVLEKQRKSVQELDYDVHHEMAIQAARQSIVLLKNNHKILPLEKNQKLLIVGDFAKTPRYQGAGSSLINPTRVDNFLHVMHEYDFVYEQGYERFGKKNTKLIEKAKQEAAQVDTIVLFMGLDESSEAEGVDRKDMKIPQNQRDLVDQLATVGKPIVLILAGGAVVELPFLDKVEACVHGYLPGQGGGIALADVISGKMNPSGKLSETYPLVYEDTPSAPYYPGLEVSSEHRESLFIGYRYFDSVDKEVCFPFGFGMSYTDFEYADLDIQDKTVTFTLKNVGDVYGEEIAQIYVRAKDSELYRPDRELKGFTKVGLDAGESKTVSIELSDHAYSYFNVEKDMWDVEGGTYEILLAASSRDIRLSRSIEIEGNEVSMINREDFKAYYDLDIQHITQDAFQKTLDFELVDPKWDPNKELDMNDIIKQSRTKGGFGRFLNFSIESVHKILMKMNKPIAANNVLFAQNLPYRGVARMSAGKVNMPMMDGMLVMSNGHFFKGCWQFVKAFFAKVRGKK